jgi:hypothetical protein
MGTVTPLPIGREAPPERTAARLSSLRVALETGDPATDDAMGVVSIRARARGGRLPVRMYLYVNGDLAEAWTESEGEFDLSLDHYGPGRHAVTARAVDALGRWAGASMVVTCVGLERADRD